VDGSIDSTGGRPVDAAGVSHSRIGPDAETTISATIAIAAEIGRTIVRCRNHMRPP
jgi:hypothetical protein